MKTIEVVAAVLRHNGAILCVQRGEAKSPAMRYKYEFAGGKIEKNETHEQALTREIQEELGIYITNWRFFMTTEHQDDERMLIMHVLMADVPNKTVFLTEHIAKSWSVLADLKQFDWAEADLPVVEALLADYQTQ
jgi:8-oxo-dGTP diphosphatase